MKTAIYAGSFNPYHEGHQNIVNSALKVFDKVIIAVGKNADKFKTTREDIIAYINKIENEHINGGLIEVTAFDGLLADFVALEKNNQVITATIRGLRNAQDFELEKAQLYWNQDLKIGVPTVFFIASRNLAHISSTALRAIEKINEDKVQTAEAVSAEFEIKK